MKTKNNLFTTFFFIFFFFLTISTTVHAAVWKKLTLTTTGGTGTTTAGTQLTQAQCPANYILVPGNALYSVSNFCVMKYEAKSDAYGRAVSVAAGTTIVGLTFDASRALCTNLGPGFDMISNDQWQTLALNIQGVAANWSGGAVGSGLINMGNSDNTPGGAPLNASTNDNDPCYLKVDSVNWVAYPAGTCTATVWHAQRRTHVLSNANVIWDFAGNAEEYVTNNSTLAMGTSDAFASAIVAGDVRQTRFGPDLTKLCAAKTASPHCGLGYQITFTAPTPYQPIVRGGQWDGTFVTANTTGEESGIFAARFGKNKSTWFDTAVGLRCVYKP